jgi:hypothetical protein
MTDHVSRDDRLEYRPARPTFRTREIASLGCRAGHGGIQTATSGFGHFCAEVPKSLRIGAHPHVFVIAAARRTITKPLQAATFVARGSR